MYSVICVFTDGSLRLKSILFLSQILHNISEMYFKFNFKNKNKNVVDELQDNNYLHFMIKI